MNELGEILTENIKNELENRINGKIHAYYISVYDSITVTIEFNNVNKVFNYKVYNVSEAASKGITAEDHAKKICYTVTKFINGLIFKRTGNKL